MSAPQIAHGQRFAVSSGHEAATRAAVQVLQDGGNVVDASLAGAGVLSVVLPYACGLGGDLFALVHDAKSGKTHALNGSGRAPSHFAFTGEIPRTGIQSATVPGMPKAWMALAERFGSRPLADLLAPAVLIARAGFPAHRCQVDNTTNRAKLIGEDAETSRLFLPGGKPHALGETVRQPELATTLERIEDFYAEFVGPFDHADLLAQDVIWQEPIAAPFHGMEILTSPPNSWGLAVLLQLRALGDELPEDEAEFLRAGIAARRLAHGVGREIIGDPAASDEKARALLSSWLKDGVPAPSAQARADESVGTDTSNIVVLDWDGNAISLIQSVSAPYGSGVVVPGTGVLLNNRMGGFSADPASVNALGPRRRPANTLCPIIVKKNGAPLAAIGTPGAPGQTCVLAQVIARLFGRGEAVAEAVAAPRWSVDMQGKFIAERTMAAELREALDLRPMPEGWQTFGSVKIAMRRHEILAAVADQRRCAFAVAS